MRSAFSDRPEDIVPRTLRDLLAAEAVQAPQAANEKSRRRSRKTMTLRRGT
ncbi:hypothetical protein [Actinomadura rubrisoli]|uniref:hypothetical protein n=1 Tax=Actinomadura rubrisoli TaxID=2530368 RepID=UPI001404DBD2|nr:hypothetical protein [Actinomadura rubrisoli]